MSTTDPEDPLPIPPRIRAPPPLSSATDSSSPADHAGAGPPEGDDGCQTPTSCEHRIPVELACPPAPLKPRRTAMRKRPRPSGADELLEKVSPEEIEAFFRSCDPKPTVAGGFRGAAAKRTCPCK